jgi:hypothetical protein
MRESNNTRRAEDSSTAAVWGRSTEARKMTSPQGESAGHGTRSQCPPSGETNDDAKTTVQTDQQQNNLRSWLTRDPDPAGRKRKDNRPRNRST